MDIYNAYSLLGILFFLAVAWLLSNNRKQVSKRTVLAGLALQFVFAALVFWLPFGSKVLLWLNDGVVAVLNVSGAGARFVFGPLAITPSEPGSLGFILIFQALPSIIFFAVLMEILYFAGVLPKIIKSFAKVFSKWMRVSGAESLSSASNIFVGVEALTTVTPYLAKMTASELCTVLTAGFATVASSMLGFYVFVLQKELPAIAAHLISASILSAPAAIVMAKILYPETEKPETLGLDIEAAYERPANVLEAIIRGATQGGKLIFGIAVMLIALLGLMALVNLGLETISATIQNLSGILIPLNLEQMLGFLFFPFALATGMPPLDALEVGKLLGERLILTEVTAYQHLSQLLRLGVLEHPRSAVLASYALCGFAHVASVAVFVGGISLLAPSQAPKLGAVAWRALLAGTLACLLTASVAGVFYIRGGLLF
jgi:CNT family concentrative nucleoside transporter